MKVLLNSLTSNVPFLAKERFLSAQDKRIQLVALAIIVLVICYSCYRSYKLRKTFVYDKYEPKYEPKSPNERKIEPVNEPKVELEPERPVKEDKLFEELIRMAIVQNNFEEKKEKIKFEMKILNIQDFPIQNLPIELQAKIFSAIDDPVSIECVGPEWKDIAQTHTYPELLKQLESLIGEKRAQAIYKSGNLSTKDKLKALFKDQKDRLIYLLEREDRAKACIKYLVGTRRLDLASFQICEQWIKDYNLIIMCRLASENDLPKSVAERVLYHVIHYDNFAIAEAAARLRNFLNYPVQNTKTLALQFDRNNYGSLRLSELPPEIGQFTQLKELNLEGNEITILPPEIGKLTELENFTLQGCKLTSLPDEIGQMAKLEVLDLNNNLLANLPAEIGKLIELEELKLNNNQLTSLLPEIGKIVHLRTLYLDHNKITLLPAEMGQLAELRTLHLKNNKLKGLPVEMAQLDRLREVHLQENPLLPWLLELQPLRNRGVMFF